MARKAGESLSKDGKTEESSGESSRFTPPLKPDLSAIYASPLHSGSAPIKVKINCTLSEAPLKMPFVSAAVLPEKKAVTTEKITITAHKVFIIAHRPEK